VTTTENRRSQILRISTRLFSERGYARTTLDEVAGEIGFTKPAIYHWFDSKDQILFEIHRDIVEPALEEVRTIRSAGGRPRDQLQKILAAHVSRVLQNVYANTVFARESAQLSTDRAAEIRSLDAAYEREVRAVYAAGVAAGELADIDPVVAIGSLLSACSWVSQWYRPAGPLSADAVTQMIGSLLADGYRGAGST
jgi:AcrR family transcriptional regulator